MVTLSNQILDQPIKHLDNVVWWMEYVLRHKGALHLKARKLPWYLHYMLDLVAFLFIGITALIYILYKAFKFIITIYRVSSKKEKAS